MKKQILTLTAVTAGIIMLTHNTDAFAQYNGPTTKQITTVSEVLENGKDDQYVRLIGTIKEQILEEKYTFVDATGEIRVEIDNDEFKAPVNDKTKVEIRGEIEKDYMESAEIDVEAVIIQE